MYSFCSNTALKKPQLVSESGASRLEELRRQARCGCATGTNSRRR